MFKKKVCEGWGGFTTSHSPSVVTHTHTHTHTGDIRERERHTGTETPSHPVAHRADNTCTAVKTGDDRGTVAMQGSLALVWALQLVAGLPVLPVSLGAPGQGEVLPQVASVDEVNILTYGVLQFSQTLHDTYHSTRAKMARISRSLDLKESRLGLLGRRAEDAKREDERLRTSVARLEAEEVRLRHEARGLEAVFDAVLRDERALQGQVKAVERGVGTAERDSAPARITALKELSRRHQDTLRGLLGLVGQQKAQLEQQDGQLERLQRLSDS
ncbi:angiopoietin-like protein 8 [Amia ocellicauda]|uniref:angiopoietin-like protein 8 n=1 Tax=Amia ocellicauda TaxID=2972642 RepID=UPI003463CD8A